MPAVGIDQLTEEHKEKPDGIFFWRTFSFYESLSPSPRVGEPCMANNEGLAGRGQC